MTGGIWILMPTIHLHRFNLSAVKIRACTRRINDSDYFELRRRLKRRWRWKGASLKKKRKKTQSILLPSRANLPERLILASLVDAPTNLSRGFRELLFSAWRHNIECISVHDRGASRSLLYAGLFHARFSRSTLLAPTPFPAVHPRRECFTRWMTYIPNAFPYANREARFCREL